MREAMPKLKPYKSLKESALMKKLVFRNKAKQKFELNIGISQTNHTYFSFTYSLYERGRNVAGGANSELIVKVFPEAKKYINLHLSDAVTGMPMYALENGYYYLENPQTYSTDVVAEHFRISMPEAKKLQVLTKKGAFTKEDCLTFVESQKPRWKKEANDCKKWIMSLDDTKEYVTNYVD
jgi:hypothetical protein